MLNLHRSGDPPRTGVARRRWAIVGVGLLLLGATLACGIGGGEPVPAEPPQPVEEEAEVLEEQAAEPPPQAPPDQAPAELSAPADLPAMVAGISSPEGGVTGPIFDVNLTNPEDQPFVVTLPCGLILEPPEDEFQLMMVVEEYTTTLEPGGSAQASPYVVCIESSNAPASPGATYSVGTLASGDLLALAECICANALPASDDFFGTLGLQFAVWSVADGVSPADLQADMDEAGGALGELADFNLEDIPDLEGIEGLEEMPEMLEQTLQMMAEAQGEAANWLEMCGLTPGE